MTERNDQGEPIADGFLVVYVSEEYARAMAPPKLTGQRLEFQFRDMCSWREKEHGLVVNVLDPSPEARAEMPTLNRFVIPWAQVLRYEVFLNSSTYSDWAREKHVSERLEQEWAKRERLDVAAREWAERLFGGRRES